MLRQVAFKRTKTLVSHGVGLFARAPLLQNNLRPLTTNTLSWTSAGKVTGTAGTRTVIIAVQR